MPLAGWVDKPLFMIFQACRACAVRQLLCSRLGLTQTSLRYPSVRCPTAATDPLVVPRSLPPPHPPAPDPSPARPLNDPFPCPSGSLKLRPPSLDHLSSHRTFPASRPATLTSSRLRRRASDCEGYRGRPPCASPTRRGSARRSPITRSVVFQIRSYSLRSLGGHRDAS